jgi:hypothetical protein
VYKAQLVAKGFLARKHWLWGHLCSYNKDEHHLTCSSHGNTVWLEGPSDGPEECLLEWRFVGRGLHVSTTWFSGFREGASDLHFEEGFIWFEEGTQGMTHQNW